MKKQYFALAVSAITALLFSSDVVAQNLMYFPYVVNDAQTTTQLVLTNPTSQDATVTLSAYAESGSPVTLAKNSVRVTANAQLVMGGDVLGGLQGWVWADSNVQGVTGSTRLTTTEPVGMEITEAVSAPASDIVLPFIYVGSGGDTEISIVNPSEFYARISINLYRTGGEKAQTVDKLLGPFQMLRATVSSLFSDYSNASHIIVQARPRNIFSPEVKVLGYEVVRGFSMLSVLGRDDLAALPALPVGNAGGTLVFPHVTNQFGWFSLIGLVNTTNSPQTAQVTFQDDGGAAISRDLPVPANGSVRGTLRDLFGISDDNPKGGFVKVSSSANLIGFVGLGNGPGASFTTSLALQNAQTTFVFPGFQDSVDSGISTGIVLLNPDVNNQAETEVFLVSPSGATVGALTGTQRVKLHPSPRVVTSGRGLFADALNQPEGYLLIRSNQPIFGLAVLGVQDQVAAGLSPQAISVAVSPRPIVDPTEKVGLPTLSKITVITNDQDPQRTAGNNPDPFAIFGTAAVSLKIEGTNFLVPLPGQSPRQKLYFDKREIPNINVVDSKTIFAKLVLSDPNNSSQLVMPGKYDIYLSGPALFDIARSNALPFYVLNSIPVLTSVTTSLGNNQIVARYEVDSPGETIRVSGYGFRQGAQLLFDGSTALNGIEIDTKFISSTALEAFIPAQALRFGGLYLIRVRNASDLPEASGEAVNLQVNNLKPQILTIDPPGPLPIIGPGPGPVTIDLKINGSNFHPAGAGDPGTTVAVTNIIPDIFPAIVPVGGPSQCVRVNGRTILRVRVFNTAGQPVAGVAVTFTAPTVVTTSPTGYFPGGAHSVTLITDALGFAPSLTSSGPLFTANPFGGAYPVSVTATVDGFALTAVFNMTNLNPGETCTSGGNNVVFVSSHQIIVTGVPIPNKGTYSVVVANAAPGGGYSNEVQFVVTDGASGTVPHISSISPTSRPAGSADFVLTVNATDNSFVSGAWINFGTVRLKTTVVNANTLTATVPALLVSSPGIVPITVTNPGTTSNTGGTSSRVEFTVTNP